MSKKNQETEEILEEDALNDNVQTLADEVESDEEESSTATVIPSNFNLSYFWNHYGYIEQKSFTSYIKQLEGDSSDSGDGTDGDDGGSDGDGGDEPD